MAEYKDIYELKDNEVLRKAITVACFVAADKIRTETGVANHAERVAWARRVYQNPTGEAQSMFWAVISANRTLTAAQIAGAGDTAIQNAVDAAVDMFAV